MSTTTIGEFGTWNGTPEGLHEHNTQFLKNELSQIIEEIKFRSTELNSDIRDEWTGLDEVIELYNSIINKYTIEIANSSQNQSYIRNNVNRFNQKVLQTKKQIQELLLEQELIIKEINKEKEEIQEKLNKICQKFSISPQYEEIQKINKEIEKALSVSSTQKKLQNLVLIKNKSNLLQEIIQYQLNIETVFKALIESSLISPDDGFISKLQDEYKILKNQPVDNKRISLLKGLHSELTFFLEEKKREKKDIEIRIEKLQIIIDDLNHGELVGRNSNEYNVIKEKFSKLQEIPIPSLCTPKIEEIAALCQKISRDIEIAELVGPVAPIELPPRPQYVDEQYKIKIENEKRFIVEKIRRIYERIQVIDIDESNNYATFINEIKTKKIDDINLERFLAIDQQIQTGYLHLIGKVADSKIIHSDVEKIIEQLRLESESELLEWANKLNREKYPDIHEYERFAQKYLDYQIRRKYEEDKKNATTEALHKITKELSELGYSISTFSQSNNDPVATILNKNPIYYDTSVNGYAVMIQLNDAGRLVFKFCGVFSSEKDRELITREMRNRGIAEAKKWCKNYDALKEKINQNSTLFIEKTRIEPEKNLEMRVVPGWKEDPIIMVPPVIEGTHGPEKKPIGKDQYLEN